MKHRCNISLNTAIAQFKNPLDTGFPLALAFFAVFSIQTQTPMIAAEAPHYSADGKKLQLPEGFEKWIFVGANLGLGYADEVAEITQTEKNRNSEDSSTQRFHNIYINPEAYKEYKAIGKFPNHTLLVMDVYSAEQKEPQEIVDRGFFEGERIDIEVAVKNKDRPDSRPDSKGDWAYYIFPIHDGQLAKEAKAFADSSCYDCHKKHAGDDNVWVQFYPILQRPKAQSGKKSN